MFRREALEHRSHSWLGKVVLVRPPSFAVLCAAVGILAVTAVAFLTGTEYTKKEPVRGQLVPMKGVIKVHVRQSAVVSDTLVSEGEQVLGGQPLLVVEDPRHDLGARGLSQAISAGFAERIERLERRRRLALAQGEEERNALSMRHERHRAEIRALERVEPVLRERAALAARELERADRLVRERFAAPAMRDRARSEALELDLRLESLRRERLALEGGLDEIGAERRLADARNRSQVAAIDAELSALRQERTEKDAMYRTTVVAPEPGTVAFVLANRGAAVSPERPVVALVPVGGELEAHLFAPSRSIGFVRPGQDVLLRYPAFPHQKFGSQRARVVRVSRTALPPSELAFAAEGGREPLYRIVAAIPSQSILAYGRPEPLQAGMAVDADVLLDRRRLIEWIFEPLYSLAGRI